MKHNFLCVTSTFVKIILLDCQAETGRAVKRILNGYLRTGKLCKFCILFVIATLQYTVKP